MSSLLYTLSFPSGALRRRVSDLPDGETFVDNYRTTRRGMYSGASSPAGSSRSDEENDENNTRGRNSQSPMTWSMQDLSRFLQHVWNLMAGQFKNAMNWRNQRWKK